MSDMDLKMLARDLDGAAQRAQGETVAAVEATAQAVVKTARSIISGHAHLPAYPASITHDVYVLPGFTEAQIGPDKGRTQGALGNIIEYGTVNNAPLPHLGPALVANAPVFEQAIDKVVEDLLW